MLDLSLTHSLTPSISFSQRLCVLDAVSDRAVPHLAHILLEVVSVCLTKANLTAEHSVCLMCLVVGKSCLEM